MTKTEMLRQLAATMNKPPPAEEQPAPLPEPLPEPAPTEPPPASRPRPRKSQPPPSIGLNELAEMMGQMNASLAKLTEEHRNMLQPPTPSMSIDELAEIMGQMGASLAKLSEEYRGLLPRIMDEPKQQTAAMLQEVRAVLQEMKTALKETSHAAQDVQRAASRVNGLSLKTWLGQAGTCLIVSAALLLGFLIWRPQQTREEIKKIFVEAMLEATQQWAQEHPTKTATRTEGTGPPTRHGDRSKPLDATGSTSGSEPKKPQEETATKPPEEKTTAPADAVQWQTTNGAPPK